ncbi:hypothetical protein P879_08356 [Paragonimus westermani]|uniref:Mini-chromosome maintenance complex-binding protein n=1 Tax=Paragonimus westermani TaxID=34504 RepID=A0A8T0DQ97_9TREM|nr:hypothetical protein P879_08356 [Paragonimus westermani]
MKDVLKINELVHVYGILEHARLGSVFPPEDFVPEEKGPEAIPRVHAIVLKRLRHNNPLLMETVLNTKSLEPSFPKFLTEPLGRLRTSSARGDLFSSLLGCFKGDALAAEYTLLHLISSGIHSDRTADSPYPNTLPALNIVCPLTVNHGATTGGIVKSTENSSSLLVNRLRLLLPCVVTQFAPIQLTLESLNNGPSLMPIRDATKGALNAGRLQLPDGTEVFVDETGMTTGQLQPRGLLNLRALSLLATRQRVPYDFQFYSQDWETKCSVLIISTGPSLIKPTLTVPWIEEPDLIPHDFVYDQSDLKWADIRKFITIVATSDKEYSIEPSLQKRVNDDFVNWRRDKETYIDADDFAVMLCLLRLRCLTYGEDEATLEQWEKVCELEKQRRGRLAASKNQVATT